MLPRRFRKFFGQLGPGLITGAADDDPSGISLYFVTRGAPHLGMRHSGLRCYLFRFMIAVQMMCARLGMVMGEGLAGVIRRRYSRWVLWGSCCLLVVANNLSVGAHLGMGGRSNPFWLAALGWSTVAVLTLANCAIFVT